MTSYKLLDHWYFILKVLVALSQPEMTSEEMAFIKIGLNRLHVLLFISLSVMRDFDTKTSTMGKQCDAKAVTGKENVLMLKYHISLNMHNYKNWSFVIFN